MKPAPKHRKSMPKLQKNVDILKRCSQAKIIRNPYAPDFQSRSVNRGCVIWDVLEYLLTLRYHYPRKWLQILLSIVYFPTLILNCKTRSPLLSRII